MKLAEVVLIYAIQNALVEKSLDHEQSEKGSICFCAESQVGYVHRES